MNPIENFKSWLEEAKMAEDEANAMSLATVSKEGIVANRMVLLKEIVDRKFIFYTNLESRKGTDIGGNKNVALCFHWKSLKRQVRIEGIVSICGKAKSDDYFASRERGSQLAAWASNQSKEIQSRKELETRLENYTADFLDQPVPRPDYWMGIEVTADKVEFWEDKAHRLHDRTLYVFSEDGWGKIKLSP